MFVPMFNVYTEVVLFTGISYRVDILATNIVYREVTVVRSSKLPSATTEP